jgi:type VI protein secretion system component VasF
MRSRTAAIDYVILDERAALLRDLLKLMQSADDSYREQMADHIARWHKLLKQTLEARNYRPAAVHPPE